MKRLFLFSIFGLLLFLPNAFAASGTSRASDFVSQYNYSVMEPYLNNKMRAAMDPGVTSVSQTPSTVMTQTMTANGNTPVSAYVKSTASQNTGVSNRAVSARRNTNNSNMARSATSAAGLPVNSTVRGTTTAAGGAAPARRVVARSATGGGGMSSGTARSAVSSGVSSANNRTRGVVARTTRGDSSNTNVRNTGTTSVISGSTTVNAELTMERCLADYTACMDDYCERSDMKYNRCYCSPRLAQIDAEYKPAIEDLIAKIAYIQNGAKTDSMTQEELEAYWEYVFGDYTSNNSLASLNASLNIDWSNTESTVRGQNAFVAGHSYCVQHLSGCYYAAENLRSIYRSSISRDCSSYETYLNKLKTAAESVVTYYTE